jgi:hypothetical protein
MGSGWVVAVERKAKLGSRDQVELGISVVQPAVGTPNGVEGVVLATDQEGAVEELHGLMGGELSREAGKLRNVKSGSGLLGHLRASASLRAMPGHLPWETRRMDSRLQPILRAHAVIVPNFMMISALTLRDDFSFLCAMFGIGKCQIWKQETKFGKRRQSKFGKTFGRAD